MVKTILHYPLNCVARFKKRNILCDLFFSFHRIDDNLLITGYADIPDECAREHAYKTYFAGNEKQEKLLDDILLHRQKLARLCNFPTYAHRYVSESGEK